MRKIFITTALNHIRKEARGDEVDEDIGDMPPSAAGGAPPDALERLSTKEVMGLIEQLPDGYKLILNLHAVEGYSHNEIAEMLSINEATSRSQYLRAKRRLAELIEQNYG